MSFSNVSCTDPGGTGLQGQAAHLPAAGPACLPVTSTLDSMSRGTTRDSVPGLSPGPFQRRCGYTDREPGPQGLILTDSPGDHGQDSQHPVPVNPWQPHNGTTCPPHPVTLLWIKNRERDGGHQEEDLGQVGSTLSLEGTGV